MSTLTQATPYVHLVMDCQNPDCGQPIPLPDSTIQNETPSQSGWPKADWKKFFVCVHCGHGYEYSSTRIRQETQETKSPWALGLCSCYSMQYICDAGRCGTPIKAFVIADAGTSIAKLHGILVNLPSSPSVRFRCPNTQKLFAHNASIPDPPGDFVLSLCEFPYK
jgi:hypothetical protein